MVTYCPQKGAVCHETCESLFVAYMENLPHDVELDGLHLFEVNALLSHVVPVRNTCACVVDYKHSVKWGHMGRARPLVIFRLTVAVLLAVACPCDNS